MKGVRPLFRPDPDDPHQLWLCQQLVARSRDLQTREMEPEEWATISGQFSALTDVAVEFYGINRNGLDERRHPHD